MKKVLLLLAVCFCLYSPVGSAELYQNRDYNFQLDIPDGWVDLENANPDYIIFKQISQKGIVGRFLLRVEPDEYISPGDTLEKATRKQRIDLLTTFVDALKHKTPDIKITYSDFIKIGNNTCIINRGIYPNSAKLIQVLTIFNRADYLFIFASNGLSDQYEQQFMEMLKTLKPIY